jgi:hypothetical protein
MTDGELMITFMVAIVIICACGAIASHTIIPPTYSYYDTAIISLNDGSELSGSFMLGSGSISEDPVFVFYKAGKKGYKLETLPAEYTEIIEDENNSPYLRTNMIQYFGGLSTWDSFEFHVPKNTIVRTMDLDSNLRGE